MSARFGNYLLQQNKINLNLLAINQEQQLFLFKITNPRRRKALTFAFVGGITGYVGRDAYIDGGRHSKLVHSCFRCNKITESTQLLSCADPLWRRSPQLLWHIGLSLKPGSTMPQAERCGTPGGVGALGRIGDGMGRHDPGQWRPWRMQYLMLLMVDLMKK